MLIALQPLRDRRERIVGYAVAAHPGPHRARMEAEDSLRLLEYVSPLGRLTGRSVVVPIEPLVVLHEVLGEQSAVDAVWMLPSAALQDPTILRAVERWMGSGVNFGLRGMPTVAPLPSVLSEAIVALDVASAPLSTLEMQVRLLRDAGMRPMAYGVNDRATRQRVMQAGVQVVAGRQLVRGALVAPDATTEESIVRAVDMLAAYADGRTPDAVFDTFVRDDPHVAASLLRAMASAAIGVRGPRSVEHAVTLLGRESIIERLIVVTARMLGEVANDAELAFIALHRARTVATLARGLSLGVHPRACMLAGLMTTLEFGLGTPSAILAEQIGLSTLLRDTLQQRATPLGQLLDAVEAFEYGWWECCFTRCAELGLSPQTVSDVWLAGWKSARDEVTVGRSEVA